MNLTHARKIMVHVRPTPKKDEKKHVPKKGPVRIPVEAHKTRDEHKALSGDDQTPKEAPALIAAGAGESVAKGEEATIASAQAPEVSMAEALVPSKFIVPKKPVIVEGITMSALSIAYFCMEIGLESDMPTYAGGLGILAGDTLRSAADLDIGAIGITLLHRKGYFRQRLDESGWQFEEDDSWQYEKKLARLPQTVSVTLEGREVKLGAWLYKLRGVKGNCAPVIFLDADLAENSADDRRLTDKLYSGDERWRLLQEAVLGIGGVRMLQAIGATNIQKFHMNEGHAALLTLELRRQYAACEDPDEEVRQRAVFTTHTPVASGHDVFPEALVRSVLGEGAVPNRVEEAAFDAGKLNMTRLGFEFSKYINGVAKKHGEVTRELFPGYRVESITNGVHAGHWVSPHFAALYDKYLPGWRVDPYNLRYALSIPLEELWRTHEEAKRELCEFLMIRHRVAFDPEKFTIGFARRATKYKRANMLFSDIDRLLRIAERSKGIQIIYAGKAHPADHDGKLLIQRVIENMRRVGHKINVVYIDDYNMDIAKKVVAGVDLWLNTPMRPQEASGTSGMKAALNGVPHFSVLDGWWLEGHLENVTGWAIGPHPERGTAGDIDAEDAEDMYTKLEYVIIPRFETERDQWVKMMRQSIAINGSFFNTHRMVEQYVLGAYFK